MTMSRKTFLIIFSLLSLLFLVFSSSIVGSFTIVNINTDGVCNTWSVLNRLYLEKGKNKLSINKLKIRKDIESFVYIDEAKVSIKDNTLLLEGSMPQKGVILYDGSRVAFVGESKKGEIDALDYSGLKDSYLTLTLTPSLLDAILYSSDEKYTSLLTTLSSAFLSCPLITKAEYDNNKQSVYSGSLTLYLESVNAILTISDLRKIDKLEECLEIIQNEFLSSKERMSDIVKEYILDDSLLMVKR